MGLKRVYLDTCKSIYIVEAKLPFCDTAQARLDNEPNNDLYYSNLSILEVLVKPLRDKDDSLRELFGEFYASQDLLEIPREVFEAAAQLRASFQSLKTPDALHLATAQFHDCDEFWTNDDRLNKVAPDLVINIFDTDTNA
ncbi:MAG TPA: type II toxin-antitoxin system VapC family toxin [Pyrinomonadaceae bacterium]|nr:type II toxin-antitoxin system VapC family toxin [Pyrinomonadaceae bacterium]